MRESNASAIDERDVLDAIARAFEQGSVSVISGAGVSTDSGIPDYRGLGSRQRQTITIDDFLGSRRARAHYWLRAHRGWSRFANALPNQGHRVLADLEQAGMLTGLVTQNVDGLHRLAGNRHVIELHGSLGNVVCVSCGQQFSRTDIHSAMVDANPWLNDLSPDFDIDLETNDSISSLTGSLSIPDCSVCAGVLKPDVVFFGESVPVRTYSAARETISRSKTLLVVGSSLAVNSAVRLVQTARKSRIPVFIVNRGKTHLDHVATGKVNLGASEVLSQLAASLEVSAVLEDIE